MTIKTIGKALIFLLAARCGLAASVVDLAGRTVTIPAHVQRIILGEGRMLPALAILEKDRLPDRLVGMLGDFEKLDPAGYAQYRQRFPALSKVVRIGKTSAATFSVEQALALKPDLAIFGIGGHGPDVHDLATIRRLQDAGTAVLFIDFNNAPLEHTPRSMEVLGAALGRQREAADFLQFYRQQLQQVRARLPAGNAAPTVFLDSRVGLSQDCCETLTHGMLGEILAAAGSRNIASARIPGAHGMINREFLLQAQPSIYIATAIGNPDSYAQRRPTIALGPGITPAMARASLGQALSRPALVGLDAIRQRRGHAIWHHFSYSPLNVVALQVLAKWLHPAEMRDIRPEATLQDYFRRFQPIPLQGTYWIDQP